MKKKMNRRIRIFWSLTVLILTVANGLYAQDVGVKAYVDNDSLLIGEQMYYHVDIDLSPGTRIIFEGPDQHMGNGIEVLSQKTDTSRENNRLNLLYQYRITSFDSGTWTIPSYRVIINGEPGSRIYTDSLELKVYSPPVDTTAEIKDVKALINTPVSFRELLPYFLGGLGLLVLAVIVYLLIRRMKGNEPVKLRRQVVIPPYVKALQALDRLKQEKLWQKGQVKEYYVVLSNTVRQYVEEQFGIDAMESTTDETLQKFRRFAYDDALLLEMLEDLLNLSDLVKFAKEDPTPTENETNMNNAYLFIEKTRPAETETKIEEAIKE